MQHIERITRRIFWRIFERIFWLSILKTKCQKYARCISESLACSYLLIFYNKKVEGKIIIIKIKIKLKQSTNDN